MKFGETSHFKQENGNTGNMCANEYQAGRGTTDKVSPLFLNSNGRNIYKRIISVLNKAKISIRKWLKFACVLSDSTPLNPADSNNFYAKLHKLKFKLS